MLIVTKILEIDGALIQHFNESVLLLMIFKFMCSKAHRVWLVVEKNVNSIRYTVQMKYVKGLYRHLMLVGGIWTETFCMVANLEICFWEATNSFQILKTEFQFNFFRFLNL